MSVKARKRSYGDFEWITIGDTRENKDEVVKREKKRERDGDPEHQAKLDKLAEAAMVRAAESKTPSKGGEGMDGVSAGPSSGKSWYSVMRTRWYNFVAQCRKKGIDSLPWDVYKALWDAAGSVTPPWGGKGVPAYKMQAKYYDTRLRTMLVRWDESAGFNRGNCGIVLVEGHFRNHTNLKMRPSRYEILAAWEKNGDITDRDDKPTVQIT